jgi:hypothetical protein
MSHKPQITEKVAWLRTTRVRPDIGAARKAFRNMAMSGGLRSRTVAEDHRLPYCDSPIRLGLRSRAVADFHATEASRWVPCRKCVKCLRFRQMQWRGRARNEITLAKRSWFITLTFSPSHLAGILVSAKGPDTREIDRRAYLDVQKYLKRLRKAVPRAKLRYLAVYERGDESGRSHYHLLIHEVGARPVTKAVLEAQWASHVHARLVSNVYAATYVTKYLTKSIGIKPRASFAYGLCGKKALASSVTASTKANRRTPLPSLETEGCSLTYEKGKPNVGEHFNKLADRSRSAIGQAGWQATAAPCPTSSSVEDASAPVYPRWWHQDRPFAAWQYVYDQGRPPAGWDGPWNNCGRHDDRGKSQ